MVALLFLSRCRYNAFMHKAILMLKKIPQGRVVTYKEMARVCQTSPRGVGRIMASNNDPLHFPCYKVVSSQGDLCGYSGPGGLAKKQALLEKEGILLNEKGRVDKKYFYTF